MHGPLLTRAGQVFAIGVLLFVLAGCKSKITKENFDKISDGMSLFEVEKILGQGTKVGDGSGVAAQFGVDVGAAKTAGNAEHYTWESDGKVIDVYFKDGKVARKIPRGL
jgi:hypothetical protein